MAQPNKSGKTMSSRLLTMKFMQRGTGSPNSSPSTPKEPPSKKQRLSNGSYASTPASTPKSEAQAIEEALAAEEQRRTEALEREAADRGETKWYLSFMEQPKPVQESPLRIVSAGFSTLDSAQSALDKSSDEDSETHITPAAKGRRSFGRFNRSLERANGEQSDSESSSSSSEEEDDEDESDDPTGAKAMIAQTRKDASDKIRTERKAKRKVEKQEALRMADERRKKQVRLNKLDSISGGKATPTRSQSQRDITCYKCGKKGHTQRDCPQASQRDRTYGHDFGRVA